jgi:hypothetical protein
VTTTYFIHSIFLAKKIKIISVNNIRPWMLYTSVVKKINTFFIVTLQQFSFTLTKVVKSRTCFIFKIKIASKIVFHSITIQLMSWLCSLKVGKHISLSTVCRRNQNFSLIRSPFVFKKSQEQLMFSNYTGNFTLSCKQLSYLVCEFIEFLVLQ